MAASEKNPEFHPPEGLRPLRERGVVIPAPEQLAIGREVALENIAPGAVLFPFTRLQGAKTKIAAGASIGPAGAATLLDAEVGAGAVVGNLGPVTLREVVCGPGTVLGCGVAEQAVFLGREADSADFTTGYGFRVRQGTLYEEGANSAQHTDTKMTLLLPWVTLGSNVNWCDLLMAGGTGPAVGEFSELGSGTIHFNFTPRGDKATASLFGDVVEGVFLHRPRLFLGGNGSMVGPLVAAFGALSGAGGRFAKSLAEGVNAGQAVGEPPAQGAVELEVYGSVRRTFQSQLRFIAQLVALDSWYAQARPLVAAGRAAQDTLYRQGRAVVALNLAERIAQLGGLAARMERSAALLERRSPAEPRIVQQRALAENWPRIEAALRGYPAHQLPIPEILSRALQENAAAQGGVYTRTIRALPPAARAAGGEWLAAIRDALASPTLMEAVPPLASAG